MSRGIAAMGLAAVLALAGCTGSASDAAPATTSAGSSESNGPTGSLTVFAAASFDQMAVVLLLGVGVCGTFGQVLLTKAFASGPPARISVLSLTQVVFGLGYDLILQTRQPTTATLLGIVMVLTPTAWITLRGTRRTEWNGPRPLTNPDAGLRKRPLAS